MPGRTGRSFNHVVFSEMTHAGVLQQRHSWMRRAFYNKESEVLKMPARLSALARKRVLARRRTDHTSQGWQMTGCAACTCRRRGCLYHRSQVWRRCAVTVRRT